MSSGQFNQQQSQWRIDTIIQYTTMQKCDDFVNFFTPSLFKKKTVESCIWETETLLFTKKSHPIRN